MKNKRYLAYLAILLAVATGVAVWLTGFTRDEPSIKFVEFRTSADGFPIAVFKMINPTARCYTYAAHRRDPLIALRYVAPAGETVNSMRSCLGVGGFAYRELAPHSTCDFEISELPPQQTEFAISVYFLPGTPAEIASNPVRGSLYRGLPDFILKFLPEPEPTWCDSVRFPPR